MPTYVVWSQAGTVPPDSRAEIASILTEIHHEVALAPRYLVQVIFNDLPSGSHYVAGHPVAQQVWVRADIRAGRTAEQKRELLARITREVGDAVGLAPEAVWVYVFDIPGESVAEYGRPLPDPGEEAEWFRTLPTPLQERLSDLW